MGRHWPGTAQTDRRLEYVGKTISWRRGRVHRSNDRGAACLTDGGRSSLRMNDAIDGFRQRGDRNSRIVFVPSSDRTPTASSTPASEASTQT